MHRKLSCFCTFLQTWRAHFAVSGTIKCTFLLTSFWWKTNNTLNWWKNRSTVRNGFFWNWFIGYWVSVIPTCNHEMMLRHVQVHTYIRTCSGTGQGLKYRPIKEKKKKFQIAFKYLLVSWELILDEWLSTMLMVQDESQVHWGEIIIERI